jgi:hypothetical protein
VQVFWHLSSLFLITGPTVVWGASHYLYVYSAGFSVAQDAAGRVTKAFEQWNLGGLMSGNFRSGVVRSAGSVVR